MEPRRIPRSKEIFKYWQHCQAATPHAPPIPEQTWTLYKDRIIAWHQGKGFTQPQIILLLEESGLAVTKNQLYRQMSEVWKMKVKSRGSEAQTSHSEVQNDVEEPDYGSLAEIDNNTNRASLAGYEPVRTYDTESSCASIQSLIPLRRCHPRNVFTVGTVLAIIGGDTVSGDKYSCNLWLIHSSAEDCFFCVRIKTYKGNGITHLVGPDRQSDVDAHAVMHIRGEPPIVLDTEPQMKKKPLAVVLEKGIDGRVLGGMSRARFTGNERKAYNTSAVIIGKLDNFSTALLEIYGEQISG